MYLCLVLKDEEISFQLIKKFFHPRDNVMEIYMEMNVRVLKKKEGGIK